MTAHDQLGRKVVDAVLKKFKDGEWECNGGMGKDFVRTSTSKKHPSPDHAFMDSVTKLKLTFEYKPQTESPRGILTGLGQAVAYLEQSDISFLVIPKKLDDGYDIEAQMTEIIANQIVGNLPTGLIIFDNDNPTDVTMVHNVNDLLGRKQVGAGTVGRFWAKHQDLPIPLFHLLLHYHYLVKIRQRTGDPFATCWKEELFKQRIAIRRLEAHTVKDVRGDLIKTMAGRKEIKFFEKRLKKIRGLSSKEKPDAIKKLKNDARTDVVGDNYYNSTVEKNFKAFLQHIGVSVDRELTDLGFKLYNIGLTNGPNSKIFRDYFTKCVLEEGKHLDLIFDLDELAKKHRGEKTTEEIIVVMEKKYEEDGLISRNPNRIVGAASKTEFLKYELILWRSLGLVQTKGSAKPNLTINWRKITEVLGYPELL